MKRLVQIEPEVYLIQGGSNMGLIARGEEAILIDTGLDKDAGKNALRAVSELEAELRAVIITHAHADHFGGGEYITRRCNCEVYAPALEDAVAANPLLEPLYLFGGAEPPYELRNKFLLAKPCPVHHHIDTGTITIGEIELNIVPLPGHSPGQIGVGYGDTLFCADAFFPIAVLEKYKIPFYTQINRAIATLEMLMQADYEHYIPGHGAPVEPNDAVIPANIARLQEICEIVYELLAQPQQSQDLLTAVCNHYEVQMGAVHNYFLNLTTIHAALVSLQEDNRVRGVMENNRLLWRRV